jgi:hypothetical protein
MTPMLIVVGLLAFLVGWHYFMYRLSGRPWSNPLWMAFTLTAVALLYAVTGLLGYDVPRHNPFIDRPVVWVGDVVWQQVTLGSAMLLVSAPLWWLGLKRLRVQRPGVTGGEGPLA